MTDGVEIHGRVFRLRPLTGRAVLALTAAQQQVEDATDTTTGLELELRHVAGRLDQLAEQETFDRGERDRLLEERRTLRAELAAAQETVLRGQMLVLLARCEPHDDVDVDWCMEHVQWPGDFTRIMGGDDPDPPVGSGVPDGTP